MKIKIVLYAISWVVGGLFCGCVDDPGNYDYADRDSIMPFEILGLKDTTLQILSEVTLTPELKGMKNESLYDFTWFSYPNGVKYGNPGRDTLGREKNLRFVMKYPAGASYTLVYEVRDRSTGMVSNKRIKIMGASSYSKGWFVLKDEGGQTDIDFVSPAGEVDPDLLRKAIGERMAGKAVQLMYQASNYYNQVVNPDGSLTLKTGLKALHILSEGDIWVVNPDDFTLYKRYADVFYAIPEVRRPQNVFMLGSDFYLVNDGKLMSIYGMGKNLGKVGYPRIGDGDLHSDVMITGSRFGSPFVFSKESHSFLLTGNLETELSYCMEQEEGGNPTVSPTNMNADLIRMIPRSVSAMSAKGWAIMKSITGPEEYYLADVNCMYGFTYPFADFDTIPGTREFLHADVYGSHFLNNFYFAKGNVLSYYQKNDSDALSVEKKNIWPDFGQDEKIAYISEISSPSNMLVVLTNSADGWRMYRFTLKGDGTSPEIDQLLEPVYKGKGDARTVVYRAS